MFKNCIQTMHIIINNGRRSSIGSTRKSIFKYRVIYLCSKSITKRTFSSLNHNESKLLSYTEARSSAIR